MRWRYLGLGDLNALGAAESTLDVTVDGELTSGEGGNHDDTGTETDEETLGTELTGHLDKTRGDGLTLTTLGLVDLGKKGIGGLRDDGSSSTGDDTTTQVDGGHGRGRKLILGLANGGNNVFTIEGSKIARSVSYLLISAFPFQLTQPSRRRRTWPWCRGPA